MKKPDNLVFALLPGSVLSKAKSLADTYRAEQQLQELVSQKIWILAGMEILLVLTNGANALVFKEITFGWIKDGNSWAKITLVVYTIFIGLGGLIFMFNCVVAWLELFVYRKLHPFGAIPEESLRFYSASTWIPLVPLTIFPAIINLWFSTAFFFGVLSIVFVIAILLSLFSDV